MAGGWATQRRVDDLDDIDAWMARRNTNVALRDEAEAMGRDLWDQATRDGQDLAAAQPSDLVAIGAGALDRRGSSGFLASAGPPTADEPRRRLILKLVYSLTASTQASTFGRARPRSLRQRRPLGGHRRTSLGGTEAGRLEAPRVGRAS
jgi:hypothetical protein